MNEWADAKKKTINELVHPLWEANESIQRYGFNTLSPPETKQLAEAARSLVLEFEADELLASED